MRKASLLSAIVLSTAAACVARDPVPATVAARSAAPNLDAARALDAQGVLAFGRGAYRDAIQFFREAHRLGGPPSELWNEARCHEHLDEIEEAADVLEAYLRKDGLSKDERADAERELAQMKARPSLLTVTTTPPGAAAVLDGHPLAGPTPLTVPIPAGAHTLVVRGAGFADDTEQLQARYGRAVIVEIDLAKATR
jgi:tetratricopeptide (TPR) repeat protein